LGKDCSKVSGYGDLFINTFGALDTHTLFPGETLIVDNFHLVAFTDSCSYTVKKFGGLKETILGGEGLVTEITGPGDVFIQTKILESSSNGYGLCLSQWLVGQDDNN